jgi:hypothetical protein
MKVLITLKKTNNGRVELSCLRSTNERGRIGMGCSLPPFNPNAMPEVEAILRNLGVDDAVATDRIARLRQAGPNELVKVEDRDVPEDVLQENGFEGI